MRSGIDFSSGKCYSVFIDDKNAVGIFEKEQEGEQMNTEYELLGSAWTEAEEPAVEKQHF